MREAIHKRKKHIFIQALIAKRGGWGGVGEGSSPPESFQPSWSRKKVISIEKIRTTFLLNQKNQTLKSYDRCQQWNGNLPFWLFIRLLSFVLPAYFNLLTLFNQTYKHKLLNFSLKNLKMHSCSLMMMIRIAKNDYISVGINLFIKTSIHFHFWSHSNCFSITEKEKKCSILFAPIGAHYVTKHTKRTKWSDTRFIFTPLEMVKFCNFVPSVKIVIKNILQTCHK